VFGNDGEKREKEYGSTMTANSTQPTVLIAEDHADMRLLYTQVFEKAGFHVIAVSDGERAWEVLKTVRVDLLVTDYEMPPGLNGLELVVRLKKENAKAPAIILISGKDGLSEASARNVGVDCYLRKPFTVDSLLEKAISCLSPTGGPKDNGIP
jgi:CheY-like chemotaxis protein